MRSNVSMDMIRVAVILIIVLIGSVTGQDAEFWNNQARTSLERALALQNLNIGEAKNIIFFLGDGMSIPTVTAARIRQGQLAGNTGEENDLAWDTFPHVGLIKTYNTDAQTPDSAGTATAFFCGVKTKSGIIGIDDRVTYTDCNSGIGGEVDSVLQLAHQKGKETGIVTTARITHATPAALYAHSASRNWENNDDIPAEDSACKDIAAQLVDDNPFIKVILGGGRREFMNDTDVDPEYNNRYGYRTDGRNLIQTWLEGKENARYVWNKTEFAEVSEEDTDYLLGLFEHSHMQYASVAELGNDPSIADMTEKAIKFLQKGENGFFLAVEGGRVDHAHHAGNAYNALGDAIAMSDAVARALEMTSTEDTLIIVTADHAHTMAFAGYPDRGNPILGLSESDGTDDLPYTTLGYLNGPGAQLDQVAYSRTGQRRNLTEEDTEDIGFLQQAIVPLSSETHGGEDVAIYAIGPMAHLFHGVQEQHYIAHVMRYAGCYDDQDNVCNTQLLTTPTPDDGCGSAPEFSRSKFVIFLCLTASAVLAYIF